MAEKTTNNASLRTRKAIREEFARLLYKQKSLDKISVTELARGAGISRSTFYTHYQSVDEVAADIKNETLKFLADQRERGGESNPEQVIDAIYHYLKKNDRFFKLIFKTAAATEFALNLGGEYRQQIERLIENNHRIKDNRLLGLEVQALADGLALQCIRYYRGDLDATLEEIMDCSKAAFGRLLAARD